MAPGFGDRTAADDQRTAALVRQTALTDLARTALLGAQCGPLLERAARIVQDALDAETCDIYEYVSGGHDLLLRASAYAPGPQHALTTVDLTVLAPGPPGFDGPVSSQATLVIPIGAAAPFGCVAVRAQEHDCFRGEDRHFVAQAADILAAALERLVAEDDRRLAALQDPLTGLPNRALILDHLRLALARSQRRPSVVGVLFVDLDRFKVINDTLGHEAGDDVLVAVGERLRSALRPPDTIGRLGGDEFVAVCEDLGGREGALVVAERLAATLEAPIRLAGREVRIHASIGVTISKGGATNPAALLTEADGAMFWAKRRGHRVALFDERMRVGTGLDSNDRVPDIRPIGAAERLNARLVELQADIDPDRLDLRELPAG